MEAVDVSTGSEALRGFVYGITAFGVPIISAAFWYTNRRISELQQDIESRSAESRSDRDKLWDELRDLREKVLTRLGDMPTRAEMDTRLGASEARITNVVRNGSSRNGG